jgi:hypothetical protein
MAFIIGGHQRSGTTMLFYLCRRHRDLGLTGEFRCFDRLDVPFAQHVQGLQTRWYRKSFLWRIGRRQPWIFKAGGGIFLTLYLSKLRATVGDRKVCARDVEETLRWIFRKPLVGDKYPRYVFKLDTLSAVPDLKRIIIYRDARDVVSSFLYMLRTKWKDFPMAKKNPTAATIAAKWVEAIGQMERNRDSLLTIRYEEFVRNPAAGIVPLAEYLGIDPEGFRIQLVHDRSIGKSEQGLTPQERSAVLEVAGKTLARLGYPV